MYNNLEMDPRVEKSTKKLLKLLKKLDYGLWIR